MKKRTIYLIFSILGVALPLTQFIPWVAQNGLNVNLFVKELFSTRIGGFFGLDVFVSALVSIFFICTEGNRLGIRRLWVPIIGVFLVGVSFSLPFFLYMRQKHLEGIRCQKNSTLGIWS